MSAKTEEPVKIDTDVCVGCGTCAPACAVECIAVDPATGKAKFGHEENCLHCGHCFASCPTGAISMRGVTAAEVRQFPKGAGSIVDFDTLSAVVQSRRSIRVYQKKPVPRELFEKLIGACRHAPTAVNFEKLTYVVITEKWSLDEIRGLVLAGLPKNAYLEAAERRSGDPVIQGAPALIVANAPWVADAVIAMETIELLAPSLGLGTCWDGFVMHSASVKPELRAVFARLGLPFDGRVDAALMIGFPDETYIRAPPRKNPHIIWH